MNYKGLFSKRFLTMMAAAGVIALAPLSRAGAVGYKQTNLVSDKTAATNPVALHIDPNLLTHISIFSVHYQFGKMRRKL